MAQDLIARRRAGFPSNNQQARKGNFARALAIHAFAQMDGCSLEAAVARRYSGSREALALVQRAPTAIADTTTPGWAADLVGQQVADFAAVLRPLSALARLRELGAAFELAGPPLSVPVRLPHPGVTGAAWVAEGGAIPVLALKIGAGKLIARKAAAICPFSLELQNATARQAERILQAIVIEDLAELIDTSLSDDTAASAVRPAGLLNGVVPLASIDAATDLAALAAAMATAKATLPALIVHPERLSTLWGHAAYGVQLQAGKLGPFVAVPSYFVEPGTLVALDASAFASGLGAPDIATSKAAALTMANADGVAPTQAIDAAGAIGTPSEVLPDGGIPIAGGAVGAGAANIVAESMLQTLASALRVVAPVSWTMTRPGAVAAVSGASW